MSCLYVCLQDESHIAEATETGSVESEPDEQDPQQDTPAMVSDVALRDKTGKKQQSPIGTAADGKQALSMFDNRTKVRTYTCIHIESLGARSLTLALYLDVHVVNGSRMCPSLLTYTCVHLLCVHPSLLTHASTYYAYVRGLLM